MSPHGNFLKMRDHETLDPGLRSEDVWVLLSHKDSPTPGLAQGGLRTNAYETETSCDLAATHLPPGLS